MSWYERLGVRPVINAAGRYTWLGGSVMPPEVVAAIADAARCHVDIHHLHRQAGAYLAELTGNEAAYVTTGAGAGIVLSVLAASTGADEAAIRRCSEGRSRRPEVIVQRAHRVPYIPALTLAGADIVEIGSLMGTGLPDLEGAYSERTAAVFVVAGEHVQRGGLPLPEVIESAHARGIPVIVDAAAQLPPQENLWHFTRDLGADVALFSGGKDLCGPQASGLVVGTAAMIEAIRLHASPNQRLARALKTGKEEIVGLVAAVEHYLAVPEQDRALRWDRVLEQWERDLATLAGVRLVRDPRNEAGQPLPRLLLSWDGGPAASEVVAGLLAGNQPVAVVVAGHRTIGLTPETVTDAEADIASARIRHVLAELLGDER